MSRQPLKGGCITIYHNQKDWISIVDQVVEKNRKTFSKRDH